MSVTTCVRCDSEPCNEQLHYDPLQRPHEWKLPDTWFSVVRGDTQLHEAWHFCSLRCLGQWFSLQRNSKEEATR